MVVVRSRASVILWLAGIAACMAGIAALMRSTVSMMFEPGSLKTTTVTDGSPLMNPPDRLFSTASTRVATSWRRTAAPFFCATMSSLYSSARAS